MEVREFVILKSIDFTTNSYTISPEVFQAVAVMIMLSVSYALGVPVPVP